MFLLNRRVKYLKARKKCFTKETQLAYQCLILGSKEPKMTSQNIQIGVIWTILEGRKHPNKEFLNVFKRNEDEDTLWQIWFKNIMLPSLAAETGKDNKTYQSFL